MIEQIVRQTNALVSEMCDTGKPDKRVLAVAVEINQKYLEYLEELENAVLPVHSGIDVELDGQIVHFRSFDAFSNWLAEQL